MSDKQRVMVTQDEKEMLADGCFVRARKALGMDIDCVLSRTNWEEALPLIKRGLELTAGVKPKRKRRTKAEMAAARAVLEIPIDPLGAAAMKAAEVDGEA